jgi:hypothetical protein
MTGPILPPGSYFVYYFLARDNVRCDRDGNYLNRSNEAGAGVIFEDLEEAKAYARAVAGINLKIGAGVYNSSWQVVAEFLHPDFVEQQRRATSPSRSLTWAAVLLVFGSLFLWWEVHSHWTLVIGFLIGTRLLLAGILRAARALAVIFKR